MNGSLIFLLLPEALLVAAALGCLAVGAVKHLTPSRHASLAFVISLGGIALAVAATLWWSPDGRLADGMIAVDRLARVMSLAVLAMSLGTVVFLRECPAGRHAAENFAVLLLAVVGLLVMVATENLLMLFVGLELAGVALYILAGFAQDNRRGAAAALQYFLSGSVASAFLLYGLSLVFGVTGSLDLMVIAKTPVGRLADPLMLAGLAFVVAGFGFKVAAVPFHLWAPGVYRHAPAPAAALIASGSKTAGIFLLAKVLLIGMGAAAGGAGWGSFAPGWAPLLAVIAALSMIIGNLGALGQTSVRRMLAFSGVGHAGFLLAAMLGGGAASLLAVCFYLVVYGAATLGAFGVVAAVQHRRGNDDLDDFAGLAKASPLTAACMTVFLMSLAGLPPLAGFFGKFALFAAALGAGESAAAPPLLWLVALALATSALSLYYYLQVVKRMFFADPGAAPQPPQKLSPAASLTLALLAAVLLILGLAPALLTSPLAAALP